MRVCILGAGNVASHLANAFCKAGHDIVVWNRSEEALLPIRKVCHCRCVVSMNDLPADADVYLISVKDDAVANVAESLYDILGTVQSVVAHTAGSLPKTILEQHFPLAGVLYPMQTFSKAKNLNYKNIPFFVEGEDEAGKTLCKLAESISDAVYNLDGELRKKLHLASVFACNFSNHCFAVSEEILAEMNLPFSIMLPLLNETFGKVVEMRPRDAQTGPAVREDHSIMQEHLRLLDGMAEEKEIYNKISHNIIKYKKRHD